VWVGGFRSQLFAWPVEKAITTRVEALEQQKKVGIFDGCKKV